MLDSVWAPEFAAAGFVHALEEVDEVWVRDEHEVDFLEPLVRANRYQGKTFGVSPFADARALVRTAKARVARPRPADDLG